jgi:hypothetical protein
LIYFCTCGHSKEIHNLERAKYGPNNFLIGVFKNGCRGANCKCKYFRMKARLKQMKPAQRRSLLQKVREALGVA